MKTSLRNNILILFVFLILGAYLSFVLFRLPDWDWYSYHYYNGWAFWNQRINTDFMASLSRTYHNPLLDALTYLSLKHFNNHPLIFLIFSSLKCGLFMFFSYKIYALVFKAGNEVQNLFRILFCIFLAAISPVFIYTMNFDSNDIQTGVLVLAAVYLFLKHAYTSDTKKRNLFTLFSGFLLGAAIGLKYTSGVFIPALFAVLIFGYKDFDKPLKIIFGIILGAAIGFCAVDLHWMLILWQKLGNPLYPYFNNIFHSQYADLVNTWSAESQHLRPANLFETIFYPLIYPTETKMIGSEQPIFDSKIYISFFAILSSFLLLNNKFIKVKTAKLIDLKIYKFLLIFVTIAYYANVLTFLNYRYILPLFALLPVIILVWAYQISNKFTLNYVLTLLTILIFITTKQFENTGLYQWQNPKSIQTVENMNLPDGATVLCGTYTSCYFAPNQNPNAKYTGFVLPEKYLQYGIWNTNLIKNRYFKNKYLENNISRIFEKTDNNLYFTYSVEMLGKNQADLKLYNKAVEFYSNGKIKKLSNCKTIAYDVYGYKTPRNEMYLCKLK